MKAGDLIKCGEEMGIILDTRARPPGLICGQTVVWIDVLWEDGDIEGISPEDIDETINTLAHPMRAT